MAVDVRDLEVSGSEAGVAALDALVDEYLRSGQEVAQRLEAALSVDPDMAMAHVVNGYLLMLSGIETIIARAPDCLARAEALSATMTRRERMHLAALSAWIDGRLDDANRIWDEILVEWPHDVLAFRLAHYLYFYLGQIGAMRESVDRILPEWGAGVPGWGYVLGCRGFALEETGAYREAEENAKRAVEIEPRDIWAGHAVAHVMEMQGRQADGIAWIDAHEGVWRGSGVFNNHVWWHRALYRLEREDVAGVLDAFDREIWPVPSEDNLAITNAAALLMRLETMGVDVGERWHSVADVAAGRVGEVVRPFNTLHFVMAAVGAGRLDLARDHVQAMRAWAADPVNANRTVRPILERLALPVAEGTIAWGEGDWERCLECMLPVRREWVPLGGSWAQRDVWERMCLEAALRAGRFPLARSLVGARTVEKPASAPTWRAYARALSGVGDMSRAADAVARAEALAA